MNKRPALQFYPGDWWRAHDIKGCSMSTQGVWFNLLMAMWDAPEQGKIETKRASICRVIGAKTREVNLFFRENEIHKFADVTECNGIVTIINRRMYSSYIEREGGKKRVRLHRLRKCNDNVTEEKKGNCNANVTSHSSTSSSCNIINVTYKEYTLQECYDSAILAGLTDKDAEQYFHHFNSQGWHKGNKQPITNLQSHMTTWRLNKSNFEKKDKSQETIDEKHKRLIKEGRI